MSSERRDGAGSRRAAATRRRRPGPGAVAGVLVVGLAAAAVAWTGRAAPVGRPDAPGRMLVDSTLLSCPSTADVGLPGRVRTDVAAGLADGLTDEPLPADGRVLVGAPGEAGAPTRLRRGELAPVTAEPAPVLDASGAAAVGLFGHRTDRTATAGALTPCASPRGSWWFTGAGATLDHTADLVLTNPHPGPAVVDVRLYGPDGRVETVGTQGIPLAPGERRTLAFTDLAPQSEELTVHVATEGGRVGAAVLDRFAPGPSAAPGLEWLPGTERAARNLRIAGIPAEGGDRTLLVGNPSDREALVEVEVSGADGSFAPTGLDTVSVAPGAVESVELDDVLPADEAVALRIRSRVPVVGAVRSTGRGDSSYAGPVEVLVAPAAVPVPRGAATTVQVSAGTAPARVAVRGYAGDGTPAGAQELTLAPGSTRTWEPPGAAAYVVVTPLAGAVYGAATYQGPAFSAQTPLVALPVRVRTPVVVPGTP